MAQKSASQRKKYRRVKGPRPTTPHAPRFLTHAERAAFIERIQAICDKRPVATKVLPPLPDPPAFFCGFCEQTVRNNPLEIEYHRDVCTRLFKRPEGSKPAPPGDTPAGTDWHRGG